MKKYMMAFAKMTDGKSEWFMNISRHESQADAEHIATDFLGKYTKDYPKILYTGVREFYSFTHQEWDRDPYKDKINGKNATIIGGKNGTKLIIENEHFEII